MLQHSSTQHQIFNQSSPCSAQAPRGRPCVAALPSFSRAFNAVIFGRVCTVIGVIALSVTLVFGSRCSNLKYTQGGSLHFFVIKKVSAVRLIIILFDNVKLNSCFIISLSKTNVSQWHVIKMYLKFTLWPI
ncbi:hypothetical protein JYU34_015970 [Plutella xylostella]|uniref:Transmembrane protein n=1 Tax=Plutella xylostella TaxID=51655 RepID=A0ABQ7Q5D9_PLUXY|nr:hypothetical protein JYU34_015970 [Plutella xylostella]